MGQGHDYPGAYAQRGNAATGTRADDVPQRGRQSDARCCGAAPEAASGGLPHLAVKVSLAKTGGAPAARHPAGHVRPGRSRDRRSGRARPPRASWSCAASRRSDASHPSMYPPVKYPEYRWGMTVDVDRCTGCQACVVACQRENNVPVVGKAQVAYGRAQQWLRLERWEEGTAGQADEHLPADVLPALRDRAVRAGLPGLRRVPHARKGSTRRSTTAASARATAATTARTTCGASTGSTTRGPAPLDLQLNPDVTVRQLGVMEKCTMCVQRIEKGKNDGARRGPRRCKDGDIQTACQQTCPTQAITFGNLKDGGARVSKLSRSARAATTCSTSSARGPAVTYLDEGRPRRGARARGRRRSTRHEPLGDASRAQPTWADVNRDVIRTVGMPGNTYFAWMCLVGPHPRPRACSAWTWQIWIGHGRGGQAHAPDVGDVHHDLRVLDRHRARGHADLGRPLPVPGASGGRRSTAARRR